MEGTILHFNGNEREGLIRCDAGERFTFHKSEWKSHSEPAEGARVDFKVHEGRAVEIFALTHNALHPRMSGRAAMVVGATIKAAFDGGVHNKAGFAISFSP